MTTYSPPTRIEFLEDRLQENERLKRKTLRACEPFGYTTKAAALVLTELSEEREALTERLAEVTA